MRRPSRSTTMSTQPSTSLWEVAIGNSQSALRTYDDSGP